MARCPGRGGNQLLCQLLPITHAAAPSRRRRTPYAHTAQWGDNNDSMGVNKGTAIPKHLKGYRPLRDWGLPYARDQAGPQYRKGVVIQGPRTPSHPGGVGDTSPPSNQVELRSPIQHPRLPHPKGWVIPWQHGGHWPCREARSSQPWGAGDPRNLGWGGN